MSGRRFVVDALGERVGLTLGRPGAAVSSAAQRASWGWVQELLADLSSPSVRRTLLEVHRELTGETLREVVDPFHVDGEMFRERLERSLHKGLSRGVLDVRPLEKARATLRVEDAVPVAPELRPRREEETIGDFEALFLDHTGAPIAGLDVTLSIAGTPTRGSTDGGGVVKFERFAQSFGSLKLESDQVARLLGPTWSRGQSAANFEGKIQQLRFGPSLPDVRVELGVRSTVVILPEVGRIEFELRDKSGRVAHAFSAYEISGPVSLQGETDERGRLSHDEVPPGDYRLTFTQIYEEELQISPSSVRHETQLVVLGAGQSGAQVRRLGAAPQVRMARLRGFVFDTNKSFLLPTAIPGLTRIRDEYERSNPSRLLVVGHTDTSGEPGYNEKLSEERAEAVRQYLTDDVDGWLANYDRSEPEKRWGAREDRLMMTQLEGFAARSPSEPPTLWYQKQHNAAAEAKGRPQLEEDGIAGPKTRAELVRDYMALDGVTLSEQQGFLIDIEVLGCGENFPLDETGVLLDSRIVAARDGERDALDRRVELFFFDDEFGVVPKPSGPKGEEYLVWRRRARALGDEEVAPARNAATVVRLGEGHFRTGSAVLLPEPEGGGASAPRALASALRFNQEYPGRTLLLGGHADSVGPDKSNDRLSEKRAELTHALLTGARDEFVDIASESGRVGDWKRIFAWTADHVGGFEAARPARLDDDPSSGSAAARAFQEAYNRQKSELGLGADSADLTPDGVVGKKTWGGIFDVYQASMAAELQELEEGVDVDSPDAPAKMREGLDRLRGALVFLPTQKPFVGFGEHAPLAARGRDDVDSAVNRRVELAFFEQGQEPDVGILDEAPETSEWAQGGYRLEELDVSVGARRVKYVVRLLNFELNPMPNARCRVSFGETSFDLLSDGDGLARFQSPELLESCEVEWQADEDVEEPFRRTVVFSDVSDLDARLENLGYVQRSEGEDERSMTFRREFGLGDEEDVSELVTKWHDEGRKPEASARV